jgi:osmotically-inducible protein OsmY
MRPFLLLIIILNLQSCAAPIIGGVGAIAFTSSAQEKGLGTSLNDKVVYVKLRNAIYDWNPSVSENISLSVDNGSILVTGKLKNIDTKVQLTKIIWEISGVKEVNNKVQISETNNLKNIAKDLASLGEIKARLMASKKLNSLNFSIDVVNNIAYISGVASSEEEISIVTQIAQEARFIKEVQNFVKVNKDKR